MGSLNHLDHIALRDLFGNACFSAGGAAEGTNANTWKLAAAVNYSVAGFLYAKAATDNLAFTAAAAQAAGTTRFIVCCLDSTGAASTVAGTVGGGIPVVEDEVSEATRSETTLTVKTKRPHGLASTARVELRCGVDDYDGIRSVTVVDTTTFTVTVAASGPAQVAGGRVFGRTPVAAVKVVTAGSATFTPGSTDLSATDVTDTWYDLGVLPADLTV